MTFPDTLMQSFSALHLLSLHVSCLLFTVKRVGSYVCCIVRVCSCCDLRTAAATCFPGSPGLTSDLVIFTDEVFFLHYFFCIKEYHPQERDNRESWKWDMYSVLHCTSTYTVLVGISTGTGTFGAATGIFVFFVRSTFSYYARTTSDCANFVR